MSELVQLKGLTGKAADDAHHDDAHHNDGHDDHAHHHHGHHHHDDAHSDDHSASAATDASTTLATLRTRLNGKSGKAYWRSLEELADSEQFYEALHREFPENASEWNDPVGRRRFMRLMGASLALAGLTACTKQPTEYFAPYAKQPEEVTLGRPLFFATAMPFAGSSIGLLAESHEGRPTKIEGNKDHPASLGATDLFAQASVLDLYDPDRLQTLTYITDPATWADFINAVRASVTQQRAPEIAGAGLRILSEVVTSPTLTYQIKSLLAELPNAKWHQYEPAASDSVREGSRLAFGQYTNAVYRFDKADVVVSLDADFLSCGAASVRYAHDFAERRRLNEEKQDMNRLYSIESSMTLTGSVADHRLPVRPSEVESIARVLAAKLGVAGGGSATTPHDTWVNAVANDLRGKRGAGIVIAGDTQPPVVHALAHAINQALGNAGSTVLYTEPIEGNPVDCNASLKELVADMDAGHVDTLLILGGNPVFTAPADLEFKEKLTDKVRLRIHLTSHVNETAELCQWQINEAHYLESWSDARTFDGTAAIIQPLIAPLYSGKTAHEVVAAFSSQPDRRSFDIVRDYWMRRFAAGGEEPPIAGARAATPASQPGATGATGGTAAQQVASRAAANAQAGQPQATPTPPAPPPPPAVDAQRFEAQWRKWLHDGIVPNTAAKPRAGAAGANLPAPTNQATSDYEVVFKPDPTVYDGRFANNGWLQELPKPISKLTWDNAVYLSPKMAVTLGIGKEKDGIGHNDTVGHGDRPERLHRLQRLRRRLPGGEQHPGRRQGAGAARPRDALAARRPLLRGDRDNPETSSSRCRACTARTRRASWSARSARPSTARRPERHGLQPLRRHALLLEQLPVQGAPLQLPPTTTGLEHAEPQADAQSRRHGAQPRRDGEVHLLRAAHQRARDRRREARTADRDGESRHRLPAGLPDRRDRLRRHQRPNSRVVG
jgi:MoCo/4Fe-4S cofactor protein with predicted Tat translocation signal